MDPPQEGGPLSSTEATAKTSLRGHFKLRMGQSKCLARLASSAQHEALLSRVASIEHRVSQTAQSGKK